MKKVYICSPLRGDYNSNINNACLYSRYLVNLGYLPVTPHIYFTRFLDDTKPKEREKAIELGLHLLRFCDELWIFGDHISEGMVKEVDLAKYLNIPITRIKNENLHL